MGTSYTQHAFIGTEIYLKDMKTVKSEKITEKQPRYNTKTGKIDRYEEVTVKEAEVVYKVLGIEVDGNYGLYDLAETIVQKINSENPETISDFEVRYLLEDDYLYIGIDIGETKDFGRFYSEEAELSLSEIAKLFDIAQKILKGCEIKLYLMGDVS